MKRIFTTKNLAEEVGFSEETVKAIIAFKVLQSKDLSKDLGFNFYIAPGKHGIDFFFDRVNYFAIRWELLHGFKKQYESLYEQLQTMIYSAKCDEFQNGNCGGVCEDCAGAKK